MASFFRSGLQGCKQSRLEFAHNKQNVTYYLKHAWNVCSHSSTAGGDKDVHGGAFLCENKNGGWGAMAW